MPSRHKLRGSWTLHEFRNPARHQNPPTKASMTITTTTDPFKQQHPLLRCDERERTSEMKLSGLQREVLALYRKCLRESAKKPEVSRDASFIRRKNRWFDAGFLTIAEYKIAFQDICEVWFVQSFVLLNLQLSGTCADTAIVETSSGRALGWTRRILAPSSICCGKVRDSSRCMQVQE